MSVEEFSITQCTDAEFEDALLRFNLQELQAAVDVFEKQIDVEQRIQAGLQSLIKLYKSQPALAKKDTSVNKFMASTKQLVSSQGRLATLKSRRLRCAKKRIDIEGDDIGQDDANVSQGEAASAGQKLGLNRYYQGYRPGVRKEKPPPVAPRPKRPKAPAVSPAMQRKTIVQAVQIPRPSTMTEPMRKKEPVASGRTAPPTPPVRRTVIAHGMSLGSVDLTVFIKPRRSQPVYARSIPQTFTYIQTESHATPAVAAAAAPLPSHRLPSSRDAPTTTTMPPPPSHVSVAEVPLFLHPLKANVQRGSSPSAAAAALGSRLGPVRKRASTLPSRNRAAVAAAANPGGGGGTTLTPLPIQESIVHIPAPPATKVARPEPPPVTPTPTTTVNESSEDESGDVVTSVTIQPHCYVDPSGDDEEKTRPHTATSPLVFDASFGEVRVRVSGGRPRSASTGPSSAAAAAANERQKAKILIEGERQADADGIPLVETRHVEPEEETEAEPDRPPSPAFVDSDEEVPPPMPDRPRDDYAVRIRIAKDIPQMIHEPVRPPVRIQNTCADWDIDEENDADEENRGEELEIAIEPQPELVLLTHSAPDWGDDFIKEEEEEEEPPPRPIEPEYPEHDRVDEPVFVRPVLPSEAWPDVRLPSPEPLELLDIVQPEVIEIDLPEESAPLPVISEIDGELKVPAVDDEIVEPTFPRIDDERDDVDAPEVDWSQLVIISNKPAKPVPVSITLLRIIVSDPQVHPDYIDYKIDFKSCLPCFPWGESVVRRRLQEFVWLRKKLKSPGVYVPPILGSLDKLEELQDALQHCLRLICSDPMHQYEDALHLFLTSEFPIPDAIFINSSEIDEMLVDDPEKIEDEDLSDGNEVDVSAKENDPYQWTAHGDIELELTMLDNLRPLSEREDRFEGGVAGLGPDNRLAFGLLAKKGGQEPSPGEQLGTRTTFLEEKAAAPPTSVEVWLTALEMPQYIPRFIEYGYDEIWVCAHLDDDDLIQLGIINAEHRKILISNANLWKYQLNPEDINTQEGEISNGGGGGGDMSLLLNTAQADQLQAELDMATLTSPKSPESATIIEPLSSPPRKSPMPSASTSSLGTAIDGPGSSDLSVPRDDRTVIRSASASMVNSRAAAAAAAGQGDGVTHHWLRLTTEHKGIDSDYGVSGLHVRDRGSLAIFGTLPRVRPSGDDRRELGKLDEKRSDYVSVKAWDPTPLLTDLYDDIRIAPEAVTKPLKYVSMNKTNMGVRIEAYLDKLPLNQKKPSFLHGWKKRYFKATDGNLFYFDDKKSERALGFIKLAGSRIQRTGDRQIQVLDKRGKFMMLRTQSKGEALDWTAALEQESIIMTSDERHFLNLRAVIIDLGSSSIRAGIAYENAYPQMFFPSVIAVDKRQSATRKLGIEALRPDVRDLCKVYYPFKPSAGVNKAASADAQDLIFIFNHVFEYLQADPRQFKVIVAVSQFMTQKDKEVVMNVLLEQLGALAVYLQEQPILSMYSYHETTGVVVDIGERIDIVPVDQGFVVEAGVSRLPYGGRALTDSLMRLLTETGHRYFSEIELYIARYLKEKAAFVALNYDHTVSAVKAHPQRYTETVDVKKFSLPDDAKVIPLITERFDCAEGLFNPRTMLHKDNPGVHELVHKAVQACSIDTRKDLYRNIFLSGGTTTIPGFAERLEREISALVPPSVLVQVHAHPDRQHSAFAGAAVAAALSTFDEMCVWQDDWLQNGPDSMRKWSLY